MAGPIISDLAQLPARLRPVGDYAPEGRATARREREGGAGFRYRKNNNTPIRNYVAFLAAPPLRNRPRKL